MRKVLAICATIVVMTVSGMWVTTQPQILQAQTPPAPTKPDAIEIPVKVTGAVGEFIKIEAITTGTIVRWVPGPGLNVFPSELLRDSRVTVVTAMKDGSYDLWAYTAYKDGTPSYPVRTTVVVGKAPVIPPGPVGPVDPVGPVGPVVDPTIPNFPNGRYQQAKAVYVEAMKIAQPARAKAAALAANYQQLSDSFKAAIAAGATPSIPEALAALKEMNRTALGSDLTAWGDWGAAYIARANAANKETNKDLKLSTASDYATFWEETALGLKAVK